MHHHRLAVLHLYPKGVPATKLRIFLRKSSILPCYCSFAVVVKVVHPSVGVQSAKGAVSYLLHLSFRQYVQHDLCAEAEGVDECLYIGQSNISAAGQILQPMKNKALNR